MANSVITLAAAGVDTGPFDLYSDADSYAVAFATGVSKADLLAGYYVFVPIGATVVRVKSASALCTNFVDMGITTTSTTTATPTTTTTTTTAAPITINVINISGSASDALGEIYIDASVTLDSNVSVDSQFEVVVSSIPYGNTSVFVTISNGTSSGFGSTYVGMGSLPSSISGQCIADCDNVNVSFTGFEC